MYRAGQIELSAPPQLQTNKKGKVSLVENVGNRIKDILLTFPNTKTDSQGGEDEAEYRDDDRERGAEAEAVEDPREPVPVHGRVPESVESGELVQLGAGARVVVCRDLTGNDCFNYNSFPSSHLLVPPPSAMRGKRIVLNVGNLEVVCGAVSESSDAVDVL